MCNNPWAGAGPALGQNPPYPSKPEGCTRATEERLLAYPERARGTMHSSASGVVTFSTTALFNTFPGPAGHFIPWVHYMLYCFTPFFSVFLCCNL